MHLCGIKILTSPDNSGCVAGSDQEVSYSHAAPESFFRDTGHVSISRTCFSAGPPTPAFSARAVYEVSDFYTQSANTEMLVSQVVFSNLSVWQARSQLQITAEESTVGS